MSMAADFDPFAKSYADTLNETLKVSGEDVYYFGRYKSHWVARFAANKPQNKILDYGCGIGLMAEALCRDFPNAEIHGYDPSRSSLDRAAETIGGRTSLFSEFEPIHCDYDLIVMANVLHHIQPAERREVLAGVCDRLKTEAL